MLRRGGGLALGGRCRALWEHVGRHGWLLEYVRGHRMPWGVWGGVGAVGAHMVAKGIVAYKILREGHSTPQSNLHHMSLKRKA